MSTQGQNEANGTSTYVPVRIVVQVNQCPKPLFNHISPARTMYRYGPRSSLKPTAGPVCSLIRLATPEDKSMERRTMVPDAWKMKSKE